MCPHVKSGKLHYCATTGSYVSLNHRKGSMDTRCRHCMLAGLTPCRSDVDIQFVNEHFQCPGCNIPRSKNKEGTLCRHCAAMIAENPEMERDGRMAHMEANALLLCAKQYVLLSRFLVTSVPEKTFIPKPRTKKCELGIPSIELKFRIKTFPKPSVPTLIIEVLALLVTKMVVTGATNPPSLHWRQILIRSTLVKTSSSGCKTEQFIFVYKFSKCQK